jgi:hypothetical protein
MNATQTRLLAVYDKLTLLAEITRSSPRLEGSILGGVAAILADLAGEVELLIRETDDE